MLQRLMMISLEAARRGWRVARASLFAAVLLLAPTARAADIDEMLAAVVRLKTFINPDGRTVATLGKEREGTGVLISADGLILTIGYLMVEAQTAEITTNDGRTLSADVVGYDYETGFGLLRAAGSVKARPLPFGRSSELALGEKVLVAGGGGIAALGPAQVASKREFAGNWEYLLDEAIFTSPAFPWWSGAALITREGKLVGIGSLAVAHATGSGKPEPGNMFVPIDRLPPILGELIGDGRVSAPAKPWLGVSTDENNGKLVVRRVTPGGPAEKAGIKTGDTIVGIGGRRAGTLADLYRRIWSIGPAGTTIELDVVRNGETLSVPVRSIDRLNHLKSGSTF